jgi:hypothetical protein
VIALGPAIRWCGRDVALHGFPFTLRATHRELGSQPKRRRVGAGPEHRLELGDGGGIELANAHQAERPRSFDIRARRAEPDVRERAGLRDVGLLGAIDGLSPHGRREPFRGERRDHGERAGELVAREPFAHSLDEHLVVAAAPRTNEARERERAGRGPRVAIVRGGALRELRREEQARRLRRRIAAARDLPEKRDVAQRSGGDRPELAVGKLGGQPAQRLDDGRQRDGDERIGFGQRASSRGRIGLAQVNRAEVRTELCEAEVAHCDRPGVEPLRDLIGHSLRERVELAIAGTNERDVDIAAVDHDRRRAKPRTLASEIHHHREVRAGAGHPCRRGGHGGGRRDGDDRVARLRERAAHEPRDRRAFIGDVGLGVDLADRDRVSVRRPRRHHNGRPGQQKRSHHGP